MPDTNKTREAFQYFMDTGSVGAYLLYAAMKERRENGWRARGD